MCGICGVFDLRGRRPVTETTVAGMNAHLVHRGPDGGGTFTAPGIGFGHRRLAIIDLAGGDQPMFDHTGTLGIVFNGEIYNFRSLRADLEARGHRFRTCSDTEIILQAWREWGEDCLDRLTGMFAFALWDQDRDLLFVARDRLGEKPLYYTETDDGLFLFASELRSVVAALPAEPAIDLQAVEDYFAFGYIPDPKTIFKTIRKLPPGHRLTVTRSQPLPEPRPYWDVRFAPGDGTADLATLDEALVERLQRAVRERMIADVPLGAFLSGGVDSSAVVAFMAGHSDRPVRTVSIGFDDPRFDETAHAAAVAERYHTDHRVRTVTVDAAALIDAVALAYTEPFADASALPTYLVSRFARDQVTVALSGDGGDEVFAGYRRYAFHHREERAKALVPAFVRRPVFAAAAAAYPKADWAPRFLRAKATFEAMATDAVGGYFRAVAILPTARRERLYSPAFREALGGYRAIEVLRHHAARSGTDDALARAQYLDLKTWLPGGMLTKVDRASMAHGLEVRVPLLDHGLVEWAATLPTAAKLDGFEGKALLKRALEPYLPRSILYRPKQGFSPPLAAWLRGGLAPRVAESLAGSPALDIGFFDRAVLARLAREHAAGADHGRALWAFLMFDAFCRRAWRRPDRDPTQSDGAPSVLPSP